MNKTVLREYATPLTIAIFTVVGISGVLLYLHWLEGYVKELHELLGLALVVAVGMHVTLHVKSMQNYGHQKRFWVVSGLIGIISVVFIIASLSEGQNPKAKIINSFLNAPLGLASQMLGYDYKQLQQRLQTLGIDTKESTTLRELAQHNHMSPFELIEKLDAPSKP